MKEVICRHCGKPVSEIDEYVNMAKGGNMTPSEYAKDFEGTYLEENNSVICTDCYIVLNCPNKESKEFFYNMTKKL